MITINKKKCTGCGLCASDCQCGDIELMDGKAHILGKSCLECGHCIAICPVNAVTTDAYTDDTTYEYDEDKFTVDPDNLLNFIKFRRSIRNYTKRQVERDKILKIAEAARFTPTGGNRQPLSVIAVSERLPQVRDMTIGALYDMALAYDNKTGSIPSVSADRYALMWKEMYAANKRGLDMLFFHAPLLLIAVGDKNLAADPTVDCALAASNMELMAEALGLGVCYNGFFVYASANEELRRFLGLSDNMEVVASMTAGYTDLRYRRTVPRKCIDIRWM